MPVRRLPVNSSNGHLVTRWRVDRLKIAVCDELTVVVAGRIDCKASLFGHWMVIIYCGNADLVYLTWNGYAIINLNFSQFMYHCYDVCYAFSAHISGRMTWIYGLSSTLACVLKAAVMSGYTKLCGQGVRGGRRIRRWCVVRADWSSGMSFDVLIIDLRRPRRWGGRRLNRDGYLYTSGLHTNASACLECLITDNCPLSSCSARLSRRTRRAAYATPRPRCPPHPRRLRRPHTIAWPIMRWQLSVRIWLRTTTRRLVYTIFTVLLSETKHIQPSAVCPCRQQPPFRQTPLIRLSKKMAGELPRPTRDPGTVKVQLHWRKSSSGSSAVSLCTATPSRDTRFDVCVLSSRPTVLYTVDKRCQLQPAMAVFSVFSSLMAAIVCGWNVLLFTSLRRWHAAATLCDVCIFCSSRPLLGITTYKILVTLFSILCDELIVWCDVLVTSWPRDELTPWWVDCNPLQLRCRFVVGRSEYHVQHMHCIQCTQHPTMHCAAERCVYCRRECCYSSASICDCCCWTVSSSRSFNRVSCGFTSDCFIVSNYKF